MQLVVFPGRIHYCHDVFIHPDVFGRFVGARGNDARLAGGELHPRGLRCNGFLPRRQLFEFPAQFADFFGQFGGAGFAQTQVFQLIG